MKRLPYLIFVLIQFCSLGCGNNYQNCSNLDKYSQDWKALYEVTTEFKDGEIIGIDSSFYCWLIDGATNLRMFKDSQYIVYDTVWRKGTNYIEPLYSGLFQLNNDVLLFKPNNVPKLKDSLKIIKITDDSLILQSVTVSLGRRLVRNTTFINNHLVCSFDTLSFPKNKIDTVTAI